MGITLKELGTAIMDRSVGRMEIDTQSDNRDDWTITIHWQDVVYEGAERLGPPQFPVESTTLRFGDVKDRKLPVPVQVAVVGDLFAPIRALAYQAREEDIARKEASISVQPVETPQ